MKPILTVLMLTLMAATANAIELGPGTHIVNGSLIVTVPPGSTVTITQATSTVTIGTTPDVPATPADPTNPTTLSAAVKAAADAVAADPKRAETAAALALVYGQGATLLKDGTLKTTEQAIQWAKLGTDIALRQQGSAVAWQPVRDVIGSGLDDLARKGQLANAQQYGAAFASISDGLSASAGDTSAFDFARLLELLLKLLPIILALFGG